MKSRTLIVALSVVVLLTSVQVSPAIARPRTYVTHSCTDVKVRPRRIVFTCADGNLYMTSLRWRRWNHSRQAVGRGVFNFNDCEPSCADGTFHKRKGTRVALSRRRWCPGIDKFVFKRARLRFKRPVNGRKRMRRQLFCPSP